MDRQVFLDYIRLTLQFLAVALFLILFTRAFIVEVGRVDGRSMEDTYFSGQAFLVDKVTLLLRSPRRYDVIQLVNKNNGMTLIKRVIGLPGETLDIKQNKVFLVDINGNDIEINEPYLKPYTITLSKDGKPTTYGPLGPNEYFVMGDNRQESGDSRLFGSVNRQDIIGLATPPLF